MAIFLRVGSWYRATNKALPSDIEITGIIDDPDAQYPTSDEIADGGATPTINAVLLEDNDAGGLTIENLADPTTDQQVATKKYVDDNAGGTSIYTGDGSLSGDRIVNLDGHSFELKEDISQLLNISPASFFSSLAATDQANESYLVLKGEGAGDLYFELAATDNVNPVIIVGDAVAQTLDYTSGKHIFNGVLNLPTQAAPVSPADGDLWREDNTNTGLKIRINGVTKTITVS